jgi:integrase
MYKDNAKQKPNNIFPIFGSVKTGAKKLITENQKITDCHEIFDGRATIRRNQRSGGVWQFHMWLRAESKQYRKSLRTSHFETAVERAEEMYMAVVSAQKTGRKIFSPTVKNSIEMYLEKRREEVDSGFITIGRFGTIQTHLKHFADFIHRDRNLNELSRNSLVSYHSSRKKSTNNTIANSTILNEQATINALVRFLYREGYVAFESFVFEKIKKETNKDKSRRDAFTLEEYRLLTDEFRQYAAKKNVKDEAIYLQRQFARYAVLVLANSGMRVGELKQLQWKNVEIFEDRDKDGELVKLARIFVRGDTSKVRIDRTFIARKGKYFEQIKKLSKYTQPHHYVFQDTEEGDANRIQRIWRKHFNKVMQKLGFDFEGDRSLSLYSLRHFFITIRVKEGASLGMLANCCGTSVTQIEKTYYHVDEEAMKVAIM